MSPQKNKNGFTLIEVVMAMFILVTAIVGLAAVTVSVTKGNDLSKLITSASTLAKDQLEDMKNTAATQAGFTALASGSETNLDNLYNRQWTVEAVGATAPDNDTAQMKKITVVVTWDWNNQSYDVTLRTIISRPPS